MDLSLDCVGCIITQVGKIADLLDVPKARREAMMKEALRYMSGMSFTSSSPEAMGEVWKIICKHTGCDNPYEKTKEYYNLQMLKLEGDIKKLLDSSGDVFNAYLKAAIIGNVIDFAGSHAFDLTSVKKQILDSNNIRLAVDHSRRLNEKLSEAKTLFYLGDNCGEIVLDKLFLRYIKKTFPAIDILYGVRGMAIVNDVTEEDARMVRMDEAAGIISNGDISQGTVLSRASGEFRKAFSEADVIIAKGQGNYEGLWDTALENHFFLLMAKCKFIAGCLGVKQMDIVCISRGRPPVVSPTRS
jgi:uncharacterized protein with ATP-grasp and redox domains